MSTSFSRRLGLLTQRSGAYVCVRCIKEDLNRSHFSWYRRTHHLIGVDWCQTHCCALSRVTAGDPFARGPQFWLDRGELDKLIERSSTASLQSRPPEPRNVRPPQYDSRDSDYYKHKKKKSLLGELFDF